MPRPFPDLQTNSLSERRIAMQFVDCFQTFKAPDYSKTQFYRVKLPSKHQHVFKESALKNVENIRNDDLYITTYKHFEKTIIFN